MREAKLALDGRFRVRIRETERRLIRLLGGRSSRDVEYDFAYRNVTGEHLRVLDIGGCDSLLPFLFARRGHSVTVYDFRPYPERHRSLTSVQGDFLKNRLPSASFDIVVMVSTIEHIGIGGYGAPERPDADFEVMREVRRVLAPHGKAILTFPFNETERILPDFERWYTTERLRRLFEGWWVRCQEFWCADKKVLGRWVKWRPATLPEAASAYETVGIQAFACFLLCAADAPWWREQGCSEPAGNQ